MTLTLPYREPYDWDAIVSFLSPRAIAGVERASAGGGGRVTEWMRAVAFDDAVGLVHVTPVADRASLRLSVSASLGPHLLRIASRVSRVFDLAADPHVVAQQLSRDRRLARFVAARPGLRVPGAWDGFELAVRAILGQQITVAAATRLAGEIAAKHGRAVDLAEGITRLFPTPAVLATAHIDGMPKARAHAIRALAIAVRDGDLVLDGSRAPEETRAKLIALPGIGAWTADYIAMRALGEPDAFPSGDLGLRRAYGGDISARELEARAESWRPWRAYAAMHLWIGGLS